MDKSDKIGLAISGGKDSVFAAYMLNNLQVPFVMIHINFSLRAEQSDGDEQFVLELGEKLTYCTDVFTKKVDTKLYAKEHQLNTQLAARNIRYDYFNELKVKGVITKLITAHHQSDQVETFFINLNRVSGIKGLKSIPIQRDYIIRPFLAFTSAEIQEYLAKNNIAYREDSSNVSNKYVRNTWRNILIPEIKNCFPGFEDTTVQSIQILQQEFEIFDMLIQEKIDTWISYDGESLHIDKEKLMTYPHGAVFLYQILDKYGFNHAQCEQITANNHQQKGQIYFSHSHELLHDYGQWIVRPLKVNNEQIEISINGTGTYQYGDKTLTIKQVNVANFDSNPFQETVHLSPTDFPLTLRTWKQGDQFNPLGMKGKKLVSDFFIDNKINRFDKSSIPVLTNNNEVLWIIGHRISNKIKAGKDHKEQLFFLTFE